MKTHSRLVSTCIAIFITSAAILISNGCSGMSTRESTGEYIDNSTITAKVKASFASDDVVKARQINVDTFRGVVQLSGFVDTMAEKERAGFLASKVQGVTEVKNNITVK